MNDKESFELWQWFIVIASTIIPVMVISFQTGISGDELAEFIPVILLFGSLGLIVGFVIASLPIVAVIVMSAIGLSILSYRIGQRLWDRNA